MIQIPVKSKSKSNISTAPLFDHAEADLCVACGLCLPVCPTYEITRTENESPRGRLSLIRGLATGQLAADSRIVEHLSRCTLCQACEHACPAKVGFGAQMNRARHWLVGQGLGSRSLAESILLNAIGKGGGRLKLLGSAAQTLAHKSVRRFLRGSGPLRALPQFSATTRFADTYAAVGKERKRVALFTGCLQDRTDPETLPATIRLLNHLGYTVDVPKSQCCCGGLHLHSGDTEQADKLAAQNQHTFRGYNTVVGVASGCGAVLSQTPGMTERFQDISSLLAADRILPELAFEPMDATVLVHEPCSHRNQLGQADSIYRLLQQIPSLKFSALPGNHLCCGGAGMYSLSQPALAEQLREPKLTALARLNPQYLVTTNIGCALHLRNGLSDHGLEVEVLHPVALLARQLIETRARACPDQQTADMV